MKKPAGRERPTKPDKDKKTPAAPGAGPELNPERRYRAERAVRRYSDALDEGRIRVRTDGDKARQVAGYRERLLEQSEMEERVRGLLSARGVALMMFGLYFGFGRQLSRLSRQHTDEDLRKKAHLALEHSVAQGLDRDALEEIREKVFDVGGPVKG